MAGSGAHSSVLALNRGSSSIKFGLFTLEPEPRTLCRGSVEEHGEKISVSALLDRIAGDLASAPLAAVGHRMVHGGPALREPQLVSAETLDVLKQVIRFAPNHLPAEIALIEDVHRERPGLPQILCFDTAFHASLPDEARLLPLAHTLADQGVYRYGFHGLSYTFLIEELRRRIGGSRAGGRVVLAHLGNGSSLAAVRGAQSVDTTMGFTPLGGVLMGTRPGDLDPGVVIHLARSCEFDADRLEEEMSRRSGLLGVSGVSADMRELLAREPGDQRCRVAVTMYCYEIRKRIGAFAAALGGLDELVFSGGIGEHAPAVRARICAGLAFLGIELDEQLNAAGAPVISAPAGAVTVHVIPSDEEVVIAGAAWRLLHEHS